MEKTEYIDIKKQLAFDKPLWRTWLVIVADWVLLAFALHLLKLGNTFSYIVSQLLLAVFYFHNFSLLHEAGHGNIYRKRWVNDLFGHYASIFCFLPYFPWKFIHQEHHLWAGNIDKDPTLNRLKAVREENRVPKVYEFAWRSWIPLAGFVQQIVFLLYPVTIWKSGEMTRKSLILSAGSVLWMIVVYAALLTLFPDTVNFSNLWLSYVIYLVFNELVNLPHHVQMPTFHTSPGRNKLHPWEQHITTRNCDYGVFSSILVLNFNHHIEHHFFPNLPWYRLRQLRSKLKPILGTEYNELRGIGWNLKNRTINLKDVITPEITHPLLHPKT